MTKFLYWPAVNMAPVRTNLGLRFRVVGEGRVSWRGRVLGTAPGMFTDFASVPRLFRPLVGRVGRHASAAVLHDGAYAGTLQERIEKGVEHLDEVYRWKPADLTRPEADQLFWDLMTVSGSWWPRRWLAWAAVRVFGWATFRKPLPEVVR